MGSLIICLTIFGVTQIITPPPTIKLDQAVVSETITPIEMIAPSSPLPTLEVPYENKIIVPEPSRGDYQRDTESKTELGIFIITAYDLSPQSCEKSIDDIGYGVTSTGFNLKGLNWESARVISVDPRVIPYHSKVYISFLDEAHYKYDGVYTAKDTGGAIEGNRIDLFIEDSEGEVSTEAINFGVAKAKIAIFD